MSVSQFLATQSAPPRPLTPIAALPQAGPAVPRRARSRPWVPPPLTPLSAAELVALARRKIPGDHRLAALARASGKTYAEALARQTGLASIDPARDTGAAQVDPRLIDRIGARLCLSEGILPLRDAGGTVVVAVAHPRALLRNADMLVDRLGRVLPVIAPADSISARLIAGFGPRLARESEASVTPDESCRGWGGRQRLARAALLAVVAATVLLTAPIAVMAVALAWALIWSVAGLALRMLAALTTLRRADPEPPPPAIAHLPVVSVIVALYRESSIAPRLVRRLGRLDYPRDRLDVILAVEEDDQATRTALIRAHLPPWMRVVSVPPGQPRTKPRALNFALMQCKGSIIGVYDAEDAPDPDQIHRVVTRFHARDARVACLQGVLDYYNPTTNWMSRCFTIEYATLFRLILPGIARLGLPVPLGGTTLFFRREALEDLGAWDAHNVTEDADLGVRLTRHGYRTELIDTVTHEEACCRPLPWIKQRSRWIKGYMITWLTHMRSPRLLYRQLGMRGFVGFQILFLGAVSQVLLAPVLWSFWLLLLGLPHPLSSLLPPLATGLIIAFFILAELVNISLGAIALRRTGHRVSLLWVPSMHLYHPFATLAAWKALWEMGTRPFWWDKTSHGLFDKANCN